MKNLNLFKRKLLKLNLIIFTLSIYVYFRICVENKKIYFKNSKIRILCLNSDRFQDDLKELLKHSEIEIVKFPISLQQFLTSPFLRSIHEKYPNTNKFREFELNINMKNEIKETTLYCKKIIHFLEKIFKFDSFLTCSIWYWHDKCWEIASIQAKKKYFVLHKECNKDPIVLDKFTKDYKEKKYRFYGSRIFVYNELEKKCMVDACVAQDSKIIVVGNPRIDKLQEEKDTISNRLKEEVTLFSFRHSIGGLKIDHEGGTPAFSNSSNQGFVKYFENVHGLFAQAAIENPTIKFNIKIKWDSGSIWSEKIKIAIKKYTNTSYRDIKNLKIHGNEINAQNLIIRSNVVVGVNTTALLESKICNCNVIIPIFDEAKEKYRENIYFQNYFETDFIIAKSTDHLKKLIFKNLKLKNQKMMSNELICKYLGFNDHQSSKRIVDYISHINYIN